MKAILAEAEEMQATSLSVAGVQKQRSGDRMRVSFSLSKTPDSPHLSPLSTSRATPTPAWRVSAHSHSGEPSSYPPVHGRTPARPLARTPPAGTQTGSDKPTPSQLSGGPIAMQKSRSLQSSSPGSSTLAPQSRPGLGPVISPSKSKAGQSTTRQASYVLLHPIQAHLIDRLRRGKAWTLPSAEPISRVSSTGARISFAEIQQLQSQPAQAAHERLSLRDIQAEEAELQAEVEFMKWWTAEEERIRLENEAVAASLLVQSNQPRQQRQHQKGRRGKTPASAAPADGGAPVSSSSRGQKAQRGGGEGPGSRQRVPSSDGKSGSSRS